MSDLLGEDSDENQEEVKKIERTAPVLIKQLHDSSGISFTMHSVEFVYVCCAAIVRSIGLPTSARITLTLEDCTGRIDGHYWLEEDDDVKKMFPDKLINNYAKVYGYICSNGDEKNFVIRSLSVIKDPNEISTHILEVLNAYFNAKKYSKATIF